MKNTAFAALLLFVALAFVGSSQSIAQPNTPKLDALNKATDQADNAMGEVFGAKTTNAGVVRKDTAKPAPATKAKPKNNTNGSAKPAKTAVSLGLTVRRNRKAKWSVDGNKVFQDRKLVGSFTTRSLKLEDGQRSEEYVFFLPSGTQIATGQSFPAKGSRVGEEARIEMLTHIDDIPQTILLVEKKPLEAAVGYLIEHEYL